MRGANGDPADWTGRALEAAATALVLAAVGAAPALAIPALWYGPGLPALVLSKWAIFAVAMGYLGVAVVALRPRAPGTARTSDRRRPPRGEANESATDAGRARQRRTAANGGVLERAVGRASPAGFGVDPADRVAAGWKLAAASGLLLIATYLSETAFGVAL